MTFQGIIKKAANALRGGICLYIYHKKGCGLAVQIVVKKFNGGHTLGHSA